MIRKTKARQLQRLLVGVLCLGVFGTGCAYWRQPLSHGGVPDETIREIRAQIQRWVRGTEIDKYRNEVVAHPEGAIHVYHWENPTYLLRTYTRRELCQALVPRHNDSFADENGIPRLTVEQCLAALEDPKPYDHTDLLRWAGHHRDVDREIENPDDAYWAMPARRGGNGFVGYWQQDVEWFGENPRLGWNRLDSQGLWGWDPKITGDIEAVSETSPNAGTGDGQGGWKGTNVGYPFEPDEDTACVIWISPKEAYLECITEQGVRTATGYGVEYTWRVEPPQPGHVAAGAG